ncbi:MAG: hypothetical protein JOZ39_05215, partial [Chloroflexi bacterium]|nr:hypothetical protein [Chloroflexota bacterium]
MDQAAIPPLNLTVTITDSGFDAAAYTGSTIPWPSPNHGTVTFKNMGKVVHTATVPPGQNGYGVTFLTRTDGNGNPTTCFSNGSIFDGGCGQLGSLDSGGIDPGGSATFAFPNGPGSFMFTSATDCLNGNQNKAFNCAPSTLTEVMSPQAADPLAVYYPGSVFAAAGDPNCLTANVPTSGTPTCFTSTRQYQTVGGSPQAPLNGAKVTIDDIKGYQPTILYI